MGQKNDLKLCFEGKKLIIGFFLGLCSFLLIFFCRNIYIGEANKIQGGSYIAVLFWCLFCAAGAIRLQSAHPFLRIGLPLCWSFVCAVSSVFNTMAMVEAIAIWRMPVFHLLLNIVFFYGLVMPVYGATGKWKLSVNCVMVLQLVIAVINGYVWQFRGREIMFSDLAAFRTALGVVDQYEPCISLRTAMGISAWALAFFCQFSLPDVLRVTQPKHGIRCLCASVLCIVFVVAGAQPVKTRSWGGTGSSVNGFYVNFITSVRDAKIEPPAEYSQAAVNRLAEEYSDRQSGDGAHTYPDIVVIMNESFVDFSVLGNKVQSDQEITPYFDALRQNAVWGYTLTSVYGGSTANAEFEFLTGQSTWNLPVGSSPYQQYIFENSFALPWFLRDLGYSCSATHPYSSSSWGREEKYPLLGFEQSTFIEAYPDARRIRNWISDQEMYKYVLRQLETPSEEPRFIFGITMQNHGGYSYSGDDFTQSIRLTGYQNEYPRAEQYFSLLKESDKALEYFISELADREKETIVVFFGDHFPSVEQGLLTEIHGGSLDSLSEQMLMYKIPFLIWSNDTLSEQFVECTSLNYLGRYLLTSAGIELPAFYQFLADLEAVIPAMNANGYYSREQEVFQPYDMAAGEEREWLDNYAVLQYNYLFDMENRSRSFFGRYLP